jgi:hypothetical protein
VRCHGVHQLVETRIRNLVVTTAHVKTIECVELVGALGGLVHRQKKRHHDEQGLDSSEGLAKAVGKVELGVSTYAILFLP